MNKVHWNTVTKKKCPDEVVREMAGLVLHLFPKRRRLSILGVDS